MLKPPEDDTIQSSLTAAEPAMRQLLRRCIQFPSISGQEKEFTDFLADWATEAGFEIDLWQTDETMLGKFDASRQKHIPLAGRPTLVIKKRGAQGGRSLLFNAHSDVVAAPHPEKWTFGPWLGTEHDGRIYGRGACDVKGPLVSALWAMSALPAGNVMLELVPGEEDCVTLGTATSIARGYTADACIVLEPTESMPRNASRGGCRFEVACMGKSVHGTVKWLGEDAIKLAREVLTVLPILEQRWNDRSADSLFSAYPIARPITVDAVHGGDWQGMICDHCKIGGYLELLPGDGDDAEIWKNRLIMELRQELANRGQGKRSVEITFPEQYSGHIISSAHPLCLTAQAAVEESTQFLQNTELRWAGWSGFNSGCEAGLRAGLLGTPTLVWGPGSLAQAHAVNEFVEFSQVRAVAQMFARFAANWVATTG
jgi:acetylornithine deacetylase